MSRLSALIFGLFLCAYIAPSYADQPPVTFRAALELWKLVTPPEDVHLFDDIIFLPVAGDNAPLARYTPKAPPTIEIGQNMRRYKNEYIYLSSDQDMSTKPDFEQYMTVLMTLSLANESTHYLQDQNGSLKDFYKLYNAHQLGEACALYSLQQYVSDIVMLKTGLNLEQLFLGQGSVKGLNALRIALEKNDLRDEFEDFRNAMHTYDTEALDGVLRRIRNKRNIANMSGLHFCHSYEHTTLENDVINRATEPEGYPFERDKKSLLKRLLF